MYLQAASMDTSACLLGAFSDRLGISLDFFLGSCLNLLDNTLQLSGPAFTQSSSDHHVGHYFGLNVTSRKQHSLLWTDTGASDINESEVIGTCWGLLSPLSS